MDEDIEFGEADYANNNTCAMFTEMLISKGHEEEINKCMWHGIYFYLKFFNEADDKLKGKFVNDAISVLTSRAYGTTKAVIPRDLIDDPDLADYCEEIEELEITNTMVKVATGCMFAAFLDKYTDAPFHEMFEDDPEANPSCQDL